MQTKNGFGDEVLRLLGWLFTALIRFIKSLRKSTLVCPNPWCRTGVDLNGIWQCPHCGYRRYGNVLGPCGGCGEFQKHIECPNRRCRVSIDL